ncbi:MAG: D-alanyl-D-alanine carboxypeptidase [Lachnospiraceae bacterium]|nr:D-alanyl-D-alanine carboxypeptidase [Lachnospiraceae bacterium]
MKIKRMISALLAGVMMVTAGSGLPIVQKTVPGLVQTADAEGTWPAGVSKQSLSSNSAIVMELSTGTILYQKNPHKKHYPASITKIMTAMLAVQNSSLTDTVTFSEEAVYGIEAGSSTIYSEVGEQMSMEQCLYAIMLESANEVCLAIGEHVAGSASQFIDMMNQKVTDLGLKDTHFNNPNGLPDPKHYTTAYDMAVIAREAMQNSDFRRFVGTKTYTCAKTNKHKMTRVWNNHHQMVNGYEWPKYEYKYCIGGKTGYTTIAKNTLVTYAEKDGMQLVCVIMKGNGPKQGEPNEYTDSTRLLNYGFEKFQKYTVNGDNITINEDLFNTYGSYFNAKESPVHLSADASVVLPKGVDLTAAKQSVSYYDNVSLQQGDNVIGQVKYTYGKRTVGYSDIVYTKSTGDNRLDKASREVVGDQIGNIEETNAKQKQKKKILGKLLKPFQKAATKIGKLLHNQMIGGILLVVAGIVVILVLILLLRRLSPKYKRRRRRRPGGYLTRGGRKQYAKRQKQQKKDSNKKNGRRNRVKYYKKNGMAVKKSPKKRSKAMQYSKRQKRVKESFGKNFFDF